MSNSYRKKRYNGYRPHKPYKKKRSWSTLWLIVLLFGTWYMLFGKEILVPLTEVAVGSNREEKEKVQQQTEGKAYNVLCTQANVAKILVHTLSKNQSIYLNSEDQGIWYNKYYEALEKEWGFTYLKKENASEGMTYLQIAELFNEILGEGYDVGVSASDKNLNRMINLNEFITSYTKALEHTGKGILLQEKDLVLIATPATYEKLKAWQVMTDQGEYGFEGLILDSLCGQTVRVLVKDNEILAVTRILSEESIIKECYILKVNQKTADIQIGDVKLTYPNEVLMNKDEGTIGTITLKKNTITGFEIQNQKATDTLIRVTTDYIELEKGGRFPYNYVMVYDRTVEGGFSSLGALPCGVEVEYTMKDQAITSMQVIKKPNSSQIRVLLNSGQEGNYLHEDIQLTSTQDYELHYNGKTLTFPKNNKWNAKNFNWQGNETRVQFIPTTDSHLQVLSMTRKEINPHYKGALEIIKEGDGFYLINELDMEDYVAGVIPSEMPASYGEEAAKVQAIAARTYALSAQMGSKYVAYGAQIDDTVSSQVYMQVMPDASAYEAAKATKGQALYFNDKIISSKFFATSCGYTANFGEVWANGETFPTNTPVYLVSRQQYVGDKLISDMSSEKEAYKFYTLKPSEVNAFDKDSPWFRWQVKLQKEELEALINPAINKLTKNYPSLVKILNENKEWVSGELDTIGTITDLQVKKRGQGGNMMELVIVGEKAIVKVSTEYLIRSLFSTNEKQSLDVTRADTTEVKGMALLPSAFFSLDIAYDNNNNLSKLTLYGGGYGHGVGMSQDGVKGMAKKGYTYREILKHFYPQIEIKEM
ncbi:hypothetical protein CS063_00360 [Sporanaerobium hydrogeniformans]|uniref:Uncharacterized protein n=1 Tax=Sporanaerobium hydrogeniformans TaxID=3072179 RepID=A0AC61DHH7_9FIRM|nr:SpoIID/LytB domain-containing protein [Sporanaerobium hydrogeniformans]PHV71962.1 hypothetical protein CS063_00360 [Sporanaerobium hydrogeniformans]